MRFQMQLFSDKGFYEHLGSGPFVFLGRKHEINPIPGCPSNPRPRQLQAFKGLQLQLHFSERNHFFVIQVPKAPFGISWYQGDIETDKNGRGHRQFIGRFSIETFAVAPGSAPAPVVFNGPFPDGTLNPPFNPIQMYHLGLWFGSPATAQGAGCPATVTPFNGEHNAGIQVLNTSTYPDDHGPLRSVNPSAPKP
jgi:hypothetical protein